MKISVTKSGVTLSTMDAHLVEALLDIARDLNSGNAVLVYGPGYEAPVVRPNDALRDLFDGLLHADAKYPGAISEEHEFSDWWDGQPFTLGDEDHRVVWERIEKTKES